MPSQYSTDVKAQVLAEVAGGEPMLHVARAHGISERTVRTWCQRFRQIATEQDDRELIDEDYRLALRYSAILHDAADYIQADESGERAFKAMIASNAIRGTAVDKIIKRQERNTEAPRGPFIQIIVDGQLIAGAPTLEAQYKHLPQDSTPTADTVDARQR